MAETFTPVTTSNLTNQTSITSAIDQNFSSISTILNDVVSRAGNSPNTMLSNLDMNSNQIINLGAPTTSNSAARLQDIQNISDIVSNATLISTSVTTCQTSATTATTEATAAASSASAAAASAVTAAAQLNTFPGGRLTLTSGTPVTTANVTGATTVYYTPALTNHIQIYNGTNWVTYIFAETSLALDSTTSDTGYQASGQLYDLFMYNSSGTPVLGTGPAWSSGTARSAAISLLDGLWVNTSSITIRFGSATGNTTTVSANEATYVGTICMTGNGVTEDSLVNRFVWNAYNQAIRQMLRAETAGGSWTYGTPAQWNQANSSSSNQLNFITGLSGVYVSARARSVCLNSTSTARAVFSGIGLNSVTTNSATTSIFQPVTSTGGGPSSEYGGYPGIGKAYLSWLEYGNSSDAQTWYASNSSGLYYTGIEGEFLG